MRIARCAAFFAPHAPTPTITPMTAAGRMNDTPPATNPGHPATLRPTNIVISVEFGPGMMFAAASMSRNSSRVTHPLRLTTRALLRFLPKPALRRFSWIDEALGAN